MRPIRTGETMSVMLDLAYVAGTIGFFALMLVYVSFCARLGKPEGGAGDARP
jgi:hypothetical protein